MLFSKNIQAYATQEGEYKMTQNVKSSLIILTIDFVNLHFVVIVSG